MALSKSWLLRLWVLLLVLQFFFVPVGMLTVNRFVSLPASTVLSAYLNSWLGVWVLVIIVFSAGSVSLETDIIADSVLCRACTRTQYIGAKLMARLVTVGGIYSLFAGAAGYAAWRYAANDMTWLTMLMGISIVGMALLMLTTLGVALSVVFNNTIVSVIALLLLWYVANPVFAFLGAEYLAPASLTRNLPSILKDTKAPQVVSCSATKTSVAILFSKDLDPATAERIDNYLVESPRGVRHIPQTVVYDPNTTTVVLSGFHFRTNERVFVSVQGVTDTAGNPVSPAANSATSEPIAEGREQRSTKGKGATAKRVSGEKSSATSSRRRWQEEQPPRVVRVTATKSTVTVSFSKDLDPKTAEKVENYIVESPLGRTHRPRTAIYNAANRTVLLTGFSFRSGDPVKVTVKNVTDLQGHKIPPQSNSGLFVEVQNWKYFVGFGALMVLFALTAAVWFARRDL